MAQADEQVGPIKVQREDSRHSASIARALAADGGLPRGRRAYAPWGINLRGWRDILWRTWSEMAEDHLGLIAAGVAFWGLLALFPGLGLATALAGMVMGPDDMAGLMDEAARWMPPEAATLLVNQAADIASTRPQGLGLAALVSLAVAMWSASRGMQSLIEGLNVAYDEVETRGFFRLNLTAFGLTLVMIAGTLVGLGATVVIPAGLALFAGPGLLSDLLTLLRWPILCAGMIVGLALLYRLGPSRQAARWRWLSPGAIAACALWLAATYGFAWYAARFGGYNETFGTLAGAAVLMMWLWLSAYAVLAGAELNGEIEAQTMRDSTTGPEQPMGARGATKADTLGLATD